MSNASGDRYGRSAVSIAVGAAILASANLAPAQEAEEDAIEEIVAIGFRTSLQNAINNKRNAETVVESLSAEDLGRLPDISIAESLARLPGVSAQRTGGQAGAINIRGLDQGLVLSTLNGREQVATSGGRAIEFSQYPSELIVGADVYKSTEARLIEGGIGGTVNLKLARPLDVARDDKHVFSSNLRGSFNDRGGDTVDADEYGYRASFTYQGIFADDTLGVTVGYARLVQPNVEARFGSDIFTQTGDDTDGNGTNNFIAFRYSAEELGGEDVRDGLVASVQWQPTDNFELVFDTYFSTFESDGFARGVTLLGPQSIGGGTDLTNAVISNDVIIGGTFTRNAAAPITDPANPFTTGACCGGFGITPSSDTQTRDFEDDLRTYGLGASYTSGDWTFSGDISYSESEAFAPDSRIIIHQVNNGFQLEENVVFNFLQDGLDIPAVFTFDNNFGDDPSQVAVGGYQAFPTENGDELVALQADIEYAFSDGPLTTVQFGARFSERDSSQLREGFSLGNDAGFYQFAQNNDGVRANPFVTETIPGFSPVFLDPSLYSVANFNEEFAGYPSYLNIDFGSVAALFPNVTPNQQAGRDAIVGDTQDFLLTETFYNQEETTAAYAQLNFETELGGMPFRGNVGARFYSTDITSQSNTILNGQVVGIEIDNDYDDILPALNFALNVTESSIVRLALARVISRADLDELRAGNSVSVDPNDGTVSGNGGNTNLDPFEADQIDLSYEYYTDDGGIYAVAAFYKDLDTFIITQTQQLNFVDQGFLDPSLVFLNPGVTLDPVGDFTAPANGSGGYVRGLEFALTKTFSELPAPFNGLGVTANYSYTESSVSLPDTESARGGTISLPGLSENVFNATVFYELGGFETRLGFRFRDEFITRQQGIGEQLPISDEESTLDYQASYRFSDDSQLDGLQLLFQVNNLTDEPLTTYFSQEQQLASSGLFGRQFFVGASYTFGSN
ncbi:MAG: TonB-dependent receptor [Pseudomonadota bacterium]